MPGAHRDLTFDPSQYTFRARPHLTSPNERVETQRHYATQRRRVPKLPVPLEGTSSSSLTVRKGRPPNGSGGWKLQLCVAAVWTLLAYLRNRKRIPDVPANAPPSHHQQDFDSTWFSSLHHTTCRTCFCRVAVETMNRDGLIGCNEESCLS